MTKKKTPNRNRVLKQDNKGYEILEKLRVMSAYEEVPKLETEQFASN